MQFALREVTWPVAGTFVISRGAQTEIATLVATVHAKGVSGRGEGVPVDYLGETVPGMKRQIEAVRPELERGIDREALRRLMPAGGARCALDCALWDLEAKQQGRRVWEIAGTPRPDALQSCYTISLRSPMEVAEQARANSRYPLLKVKLGAGDGDDERIRSVRQARPDARLVVDANEGWTAAMLDEMVRAMHDAGVEMIEQPLPAAEDEVLRDYRGPVPLCADESLQGIESLDGLRERYALVNIKLDKCGGLTEGRHIARRAREQGLELMVGCMVGSSLGMAAHAIVGGLARYVDLDGPLLLAEDWQPGLAYHDAMIQHWEAEVWG